MLNARKKNRSVKELLVIKCEGKRPKELFLKRRDELSANKAYKGLFMRKRTPTSQGQKFLWEREGKSVGRHGTC